MSEPAIVVLTPRGLELGRRLVEKLGRGEVLEVENAVREHLTDSFQAGRPLICIMALGIVVRILGPLAQNKETDPPVVVVDEGGNFAISALSGHAGGANELARQVAQAIGAVPVITTASDTLGLPALDIIGREWGWKIEGGENLKQVSASMIRGELVAVYQDAGNGGWWRKFGEWPKNFQRVESWPDKRWPGVLAITDRTWPTLDCPHVIYRPKTLVVGVGCRRQVPFADIDAVFQEVCRNHRLAPLCLTDIATVSLKADEPGLQEFAAMHGLPLRSYTVAELARFTDLPTPSKKVFQKIGIYGVAEPAAMLAAGTRQLLVTKQCSRKVTMAVARREEA